MTALIVGVIALSSVGAFLIGERLLGWSAHSLRTALDSMLECVGATFVFALLNFAVAAGLILGTRAVSGRSVSLYYLADLTWLALATLQGLTWCLWRMHGAASPGRPTALGPTRSS